MLMRMKPWMMLAVIVLGVLALAQGAAMGAAQQGGAGGGGAAFPTSPAAQASGSASASGGGGGGSSGADRSLLGYIHSGGIISYILVLLSVVAVALMVTNALMLRRSSLAPPHVIEGLRRLIAERRLDGVNAFCVQPENDSFLSRVVGGGLARVSRSQFGVLELKPAIEEAGARELDRLDRVNHAIGMLAQVGPMLGLLGTVIGMVLAFNTIGGDTGAGRNEKLAGYMAIALVTTAEGLILAIPCTFAYSLFKRRTDRVAAEVGDVAESLLGEIAAASKPSAGGAKPAVRAALLGAAGSAPAA